MPTAAPRAGYLRWPSLHEDTVVFGSEDDLWTVSTDGGTARRLTANLAETSRPALSPDGTQLAFTSREEDQPEVWVMPAVGGPTRRLTYLGNLSTTVVGWSPDGRIVAVSTAGQPFHRWTMPILVDPVTAVVERLAVGPARAMSFEPDGPGVVLCRNAIDPARWKRYRGGTAGQLWVDRRGDGKFRRILADLDTELAAPVWVAGRIYFVSDHEGIGNLYSVRPSGSDLRRHTDHGEYYARWPSTDGTRIVYQHAADIWLLDPATDETTRLDIDTASPGVQRNRRFVDPVKQLTGFGVHPTGREVAVETRGQLFTMPLWEAAPRQVNPQDGARQRLARWLPDGDTIVSISDAGGEEHLQVTTAAGTRDVDLPDIGQVWELAVAPTGDPRAAVVTNRHQLHLVDLADGTTKLLAASEFGALTDAAWSPDGRWIAFSCAMSRTTRSILVVEIGSGSSHPVTRAEFRDMAPTWSSDGHYLYFLSARVFDPVPDELFMDLNFPRTVKPYVVPLRSSDRSPFDPDPRPMTESPGGPAATDEDRAIVIDVAGLDRRLVEVPIDTGRYLKVAAIDGALLLLSAPIEGSLGRDIFGHKQPAYELVKLSVPDAKRDTFATDVADFTVSADRSTVVYRSQQRLRALPTAGEPPKSEEPGADEPKRASGWLDLGRLRLSVNPAAEWMQMYREAWRLQREYFWDETMSGVDWERVYDRYRPLVDRLGARSELADLLWDMQGELGTSHAYEMGGEYRPPLDYPLGFLGADLEMDGRGRWRVARIPQTDHWHPESGSPLEAPGIDVAEGDRLLAVDGRPVDADVSPQSLLVNQAGNQVELTVADARGRRTRRVVVTTLRDEQPLRYRAWVLDRRRYVHDATDGRVGYVHIPDMGTWGYAEFHRSFLAEMDREALVVDIRDNRGGFVSALLLEKLARPRLGRDVLRYGPSEPYPADAPSGPMVCLTNQNAGSDGDIFSHAWKMLGLGPLVGTRTWGGVVGIDGRARLIDGGLTTQPMASFWFSDVGWAVENYGTDPDIVVDKTPQDWAADADPQLDRGLALVRRALRSHKPLAPERSPRPRLTLPTLPPR